MRGHVRRHGRGWSFVIDAGRDPGPRANPANYFIRFGLFGVFAGGIFACAMPLGEKPGPAAVHFVRGWDVPVGGLLVTGAGFYALLGFPLDDIWHRLFGQDVTLWGPTHLMLIGGASLYVLGAWALHAEGDAMREDAGVPLPDPVRPLTWDQAVAVWRRLTRSSAGSRAMSTPPNPFALKAVPLRRVHGSRIRGDNA